MSELEMIEKIGTFGVEWEIESDGCVYVDGGYLPNTYQTEREALEAILDYLK